MKKVAVTVAVLALGLAACEGQTDDPAIENEAAVEEPMMDMNAATTNMSAENVAENALENATQSIENAQEAVENIGENTTTVE